MNRLFRLILVSVSLFVLGGIVLPNNVYAQYNGTCCNRPILNPECIVLFGERPENCVESYCKEVEPEYTRLPACWTQISLDGTGGVDEQIEEFIDVNMFGIKLRFDSDRAIVQMIYTGFMGFLGVGALLAAFNGVRAAFVRANAESDDQVAESTKTIVNSLIGFGLMIISLVIVQVIAAFIGIGNLSQIVQVANILPTF